jgi:hypothetical protein
MHLSIAQLCGAAAARRAGCCALVALSVALFGIAHGWAGEGAGAAASPFIERVEPVLFEYCYDCHGDGMRRGNVDFDRYGTEAELKADHDLWLAVLKNVRAGLMPPRNRPQPTVADLAALDEWIKREAFGIDEENSDPGRVTLRRLNRVEYRNTIRDLMGIDYNTLEEFPPDDTGYGFDTVGDVLTISPLLLEKYLQAAEAIVAEAVPAAARVVPAQTLGGNRFRSADGPARGDRLTSPTRNYERFFFSGEPPKGEVERRVYARELLERFAGRAFRRPVDDRTLGRLTGLAEAIYSEAEHSFEEGVRRAMVAVLASPRFLFRFEETAPAQPGDPYPPLDEYALASRLSYFLWSSMPDQELFDLAARGQLRRDLVAQVDRLLADSRSEAFIENFAGQWLQARDVEGVSINARAVLRREGSNRRFDFDRSLRLSMRRETELYFGHVLRENRSLVELLDSDYTFLNQELAEFYGVPGVQGREMRRVTLPPDSPRGGVLTQGTVLTVTSNPTRTSPVKRGMFILENILGTPPPPAPPGIPELEEIAKEFAGREPTLREMMQAHRDNPLCASCHQRMDPLGLALENFNALGIWRETERGQPIDATGELITGEAFQGVQDLKRILAEDRRLDFYRCLTEKLLTYALGRGLEYHDVQSVDRIVDRLQAQGGRSWALLLGVIESRPFQHRRRHLDQAATPSLNPQLVQHP